MRNRTMRVFLVCAAALMLLGLASGAAAAQPVDGDAALLVDKVAATTTLVLEEGQRLRLRSDTVIVKDGETISFSAIPTAQQALPGVIMVQWSTNADGTAKEVVIRHLRN